MMIEPGWKVYRGMIVGEHTRDNDLEINILKGKQLTNIRTTSKDEAVRLTPPIRMTLEKALAYIEDDELVEVTPSRSGCARSSSTPTTASVRKRPRKRWRKAAPPVLVVPRDSGASTPRPLGLITNTSGILDPPPSRFRTKPVTHPMIVVKSHAIRLGLPLIEPGTWPTAETCEPGTDLA